MNIGDWGQISKDLIDERGYVPILDCVMKKVKENELISGVTFVGDLGYDLEGDLYTSMLKYIEPLTKGMVWIGIPGNHDTTYHDDNFVLYTESFLTP